MKVVSFSEARNSLKTVLDRVVEDADYLLDSANLTAASTAST